MNSKVSANIGYYNRVRFFSLAEANDLLPILIKITRESLRLSKAHDEILEHEDLSQAFLDLVSSDKDKVKLAWQTKLEKLGVLVDDNLSAEAFGHESFGKARFDTGYGYLLWHFPQSSLQEFQAYDSANIELIDIIQIKHPHWLGVDSTSEKVSANKDIAYNKQISNDSDDSVIANARSSLQTPSSSS